MYFLPFQSIDFAPSASDTDLLTSGSCAVALVYVSYSYLGWNAANYMAAGEWQDGSKTLTNSLIAGTLIVTVVYVLLNFTFLATTPLELMRGELEIVFVVARHAFGP